MISAVVSNTAGVDSRAMPCAAEPTAGSAEWAEAAPNARANPIAAIARRFATVTPRNRFPEVPYMKAPSIRPAVRPGLFDELASTREASLLEVAGHVDHEMRCVRYWIARYAEILLFVVGSPGVEGL